jgi:hypothetical protein
MVKLFLSLCAPPPLQEMKCHVLSGPTLVSQLSEPLPRDQQLTALPRHQPSFDRCQQVALGARRDLFQMATVVRLVETEKDVGRYRYINVLCRKLLNIDKDSAYRYVTARKHWSQYRARQIQFAQCHITVLRSILILLRRT